MVEPLRGREGGGGNIKTNSNPAEHPVEHLFWECAIVQQFWTQIYSFIERIVGPKVCLKKKYYLEIQTRRVIASLTFL